MNTDFKIKEFIKENIKRGVFPDAFIGISFKEGYKRNKSIFIIENKSLKKNKFYDLASLTKSFSTVLSVLSLIKEKKLEINTKLINIIKNKQFSDLKDSITVKQLLSHSAGLPDHRNYYKDLIKVSPDRRKELILDLLLKGPLVYNPGFNVLYSDLGYMLLGLLIEKISGQELDCYFRRMIAEPIDLAGHIFFNPLGTEGHSPDEFAPVEDCPWRRRVLQGEVSDENCWAVGGGCRTCRSLWRYRRSSGSN